MYRNKPFKRIAIVISVILLLIILHYLGVTKFIEQGGRAVVKPVYSFFYSTKLAFSDKYESFVKRDKKDEIFKKYKKLQAKNERLKSDNLTLKEENKELKEKVNYFNNIKYKYISTNVISKNTDSVNQYLIINAGKKNGLKKNQPVVVLNGILAGVIEKVYENTAMVKLLNDNNIKIAATITNKDRSIGVIEGGYGLSVRMKSIPRNEVIMVGDRVITSGLEKEVPKGLLIGEVEVVENEAYKRFQQAVVKPATDLSRISEVSVIISEKVQDENT